MSVVYFIQAEMETHPIKIGFTAGDPRERLAALQTGSPAPLYLIGSIPADKTFERWFHDQVRASHLTGEWFRGDPAVREMVVKAIRAAQDPNVENPTLAMRLWHRRG